MRSHLLSRVISKIGGLDCVCRWGSAPLTQLDPCQSNESSLAQLVDQGFGH
jgi:hypothetical protein